MWPTPRDYASEKDRARRFMPAGMFDDRIMEGALNMKIPREAYIWTNG